MNAVCDNEGQWYLTGGFCVLLEAFDRDKELLGVDENGWNGTVEASIDGNGRILFDPEVKLSDNEFIFVQRYQQSIMCSLSNHCIKQW